MIKILAIIVALPALLAAQSTVDSADRYAYSANAGWIDFRADTVNGVRISESYLSGYAYAANFGWIHLGDGTPDNGFGYGNASATDYGVNLSPDGALSGQAYAANVGWITFEQTHGMPALDLLTGTLSGFAYSANVGWIALDSPSSALLTNTLACPDSDGDGIADSYEYFYFGNLTTANATSDNDRDGRSDLEEYIANTNPKDPEDFLQILSHTHTLGINSNTKIIFTSRPGRVYRIEYDTEMLGLWNTTAPFLADDDIASSRVVDHDNTDRHFFRVVVEKPLQP